MDPSEIDFEGTVFTSGVNKIFVTGVAGTWKRGLQEFPFYRAILLDGRQNEVLDANKLLVAVKFIPIGSPFITDEQNAASVTVVDPNQTTNVYTKVVATKNNLLFQQRGFLVIPFTFSQRGSPLNVVVKRFNGCMPEKWLVYVLHQVLVSILEFQSINEGYPPSFSAASIYMDWEGTIRVSLPSSKVIYHGDVANVNESWMPLVKPIDIGNAVPPEIVSTGGIAGEGVSNQKITVWKFGIVALELVRCGLRYRDYDELREDFRRSCLAGKLPNATRGTSLRSKTRDVFKSLRVGSTAAIDGLPILEPHRGIISGAFESMVISCLQPNPIFRPTIEDLEHHPLLRSGTSHVEMDVEKLLKKTKWNQ